MTIEVFPAPNARTRQPLRSSIGFGYIVASPLVFVLPKKTVEPDFLITSVHAEPQVIPTAWSGGPIGPPARVRTPSEKVSTSRGERPSAGSLCPRRP